MNSFFNKKKFTFVLNLSSSLDVIQNAVKKW